ncbi:hypothetical protein ASF24_15215 [Methylobacterium sp. Leaf86]|nr:hypothetical protein ASF24_15215 [Methylobacterium sp. Leaf86]
MEGGDEAGERGLGPVGALVGIDELSTEAGSRFARGGRLGPGGDEGLTRTGMRDGERLNGAPVSLLLPTDCIEGGVDTGGHEGDTLENAAAGFNAEVAEVAHGHLSELGDLTCS